MALSSQYQHDPAVAGFQTTVDSRYLALVGSQNSRVRVKWFSRYLVLSREGADSRIQDHRPTLLGV